MVLAKNSSPGTKKRAMISKEKITRIFGWIAYIGVTEHVIALNGTLVAESGTGTEGGARFIQVQFLWVFFLRLSPLNSSRYALWQIRSRKASAKVAS